MLGVDRLVALHERRDVEQDSHDSVLPAQDRLTEVKPLPSMFRDPMHAVLAKTSGALCFGSSGRAILERIDQRPLVDGCGEARVPGAEVPLTL